MSQLRLPLGAAAAVRSREHAIDVTTVFFCGDDQWPVIVNCYAEQFQLRFLDEIYLAAISGKRGLDGRFFNFIPSVQPLKLGRFATQMMQRECRER